MGEQLPVAAAQALPAPRHSTPFTRDRQAIFLEALADWGNVRAAARRAGVSRAHAYRMRRACDQFRTLWDAARLIARPQVEDVLADRALNGVEEKVFYHGEEVATRRRYDARLLLAHIARLDRLSGSKSAREATYAFDEELEELRDCEELDWVVAGDDEDAIADAGLCAGEGGEILP